jgi:hypothetical protein
MNDQEMLERAREHAKQLDTLMRANRALERVFNMEEGDDGAGVCDMCAGCPNCVEGESDE